MVDDIQARLRALEEARIRHGEDIATLKSDTRNQGELVRAIAPLVNDVSTIRGVATAALDKAKEVESDLASRQNVARSNRWQLIATVISIAGLLATLVTLVFFILQFAGTGG